MRILVQALLIAIAIPAVAQAADRHLFILAGQSNMTGTLRDSFKSCVEQTLGQDQVLVVCKGHPGQPIKNWYKDWQPPAGMEDPKPESNGGLYDVLMKTVNGTLNGAKPATVTLIWMQGEQDADSRWASVYEKSFLSMVDRIKADLQVRDINFVVGRINDFWLEKPDGKAIREILVKLGDEHANGAWIDTDDLNRGVNPWGGFSFEDGHYPPAGYVVMGQRFAKEALRLLDPKRELNPDVFKEHFIDSHVQIKSHAAIGKTVTGGPPSLTDGKFAAADHADKAWTRIEPSKDAVEIIVDLGEPVLVKELGVNMLLSSAAKAEFMGSFVYSTSEDGEVFQINNSRYNTVKPYNARAFNGLRSKGFEPQSLLLLTQQNDRNGPVKARKVKVTIQTGGQPVYLDEIVVNPTRK